MKVVALGDSITYGYPYSPDESWVSLAAKALGVPIINCGVNGERTEDFLERFAIDVLVHSPSHLIILGGTNDAFAGVNVHRSMDNIRKMVQLGSCQGIKVVLGIPLPCDRLEELWLAEFRTLLRELAQDKQLPILDFYQIMFTPESRRLRTELFVDGVHPNLAGYRLMGITASQVLRELLNA